MDGQGDVALLYLRCMYGDTFVIYGCRRGCFGARVAAAEQQIQAGYSDEDQQKWTGFSDSAVMCGMFHDA